MLKIITDPIKFEFFKNIFAVIGVISTILFARERFLDYFGEGKYWRKRQSL